MLSGFFSRPTTASRAYNDMCYLCEKYAPLEGLGKYDSSKDPSVPDALITVHT